MSSIASSAVKKRELPALFWYMEMGEWDKACERVRRHPREVKTWATLRTKSNNEETKSTKRLALHHACFKLRGAGSLPPAQKPSEDTFVQVCRFILLLVKLYPEAASQRESRHGCLPLHLAAFASCAPRNNADEEEIHIARPGSISRRVASDATTDTTNTNMSAIHAEESFSGQRGFKNPKVKVSMRDNTIHPKRDEMAVHVIDALLDAYPKGIRVDSEGGRLPLHTACAGRATPRVIATLITAYPAAARHRNKDGFLPLHLAAHWGVSHPNVAVTLLKAYPDATLGRNRWERTPLEEALCMAGENGRPHQQALVRALRKHPTYWTRPPPEVFRQPVTPVDVDESLPSNDTSTAEDERRYMQYGMALMKDIEDEERFIKQQQQQKQEKPKAESPPSSPGGLLARLTLSPRKREKEEELDLCLETDIASLIQHHNWQVIIARLAHNPMEAEHDLKVITRGGFPASSGMHPLHYACERQPPVDVVHALIEACPHAVSVRTMPGGALPLHVACTWFASSDVVTALLSADQAGAQVTDELGNVPLHSACFAGASEEVIVALLSAYPKGVLARNHQGSRPIDICQRLRHENRRAVATMLALKKEELLVQHRRSQSSGTWSEVASEAIELNERHGVPGQLKLIDTGYRLGDDLQEAPSMGVEVSYNEKQSDDLHWV